MAIETVVFDLDDTLVPAGDADARALSVLADYHVDAATFVAAHRRWWAIYQGAVAPLRSCTGAGCAMLA